jgi:tRNA dimethylallyltransferase
MNLFNCIVVCGPTACGKTNLGVKIAAKYGGEIISADSRQVYRGMDIGSGKDLAEYTLEGKKIPCHLIDIADPSDVYTLYRYCADFNDSFQNIASRKKIPVIVGGTGLYIEAALKQYDVPHAPEDAAFRTNMMQKDYETLVKLLDEKDHDLFMRTDLSSKKRIVRSLEIAEHQTGGFAHRNKLVINPLVFGISYPREIIRERIDSRLDSRLGQGMIDEVRALLEKGIDKERMKMFGMEYSHLSRYLWGEITFDAMKDSLRHEIHRLAKRQMTWFRGMEKRGIKVHWIENGDFDAICGIIEQTNPPVTTKTS